MRVTDQDSECPLSLFQLKPFESIAQATQSSALELQVIQTTVLIAMNIYHNEDLILAISMGSKPCIVGYESLSIADALRPDCLPLTFSMEEGSQITIPLHACSPSH